MSTYATSFFALLLVFSCATLSTALDDHSDTTSKIEAACKSFADHWVARDYENAAKLTAESFFRCNGHSTNRIENLASKIEFLTQIRQTSDVGDANKISTRFVKIATVSKLPIDKMGFDDDDARELFQKLTGPDDYFAAVLIEPVDATKRDAMMLICRDFEGEIKIVGLLYSSPVKSK